MMQKKNKSIIIIISTLILLFFVIVWLTSYMMTETKEDMDNNTKQLVALNTKDQNDLLQRWQECIGAKVRSKRNHYFSLNDVQHLFKIYQKEISSSNENISITLQNGYIEIHSEIPIEEVSFLHYLPLMQGRVLKNTYHLFCFTHKKTQEPFWKVLKIKGFGQETLNTHVMAFEYLQNESIWNEIKSIKITRLGLFIES